MVVVVVVVVVVAATIPTHCLSETFPSQQTTRNMNLNPGDEVCVPIQVHIQ